MDLLRTHRSVTARSRDVARSMLRAAKRVAVGAGLGSPFASPLGKKIRLLFFKSRLADLVEASDALSAAGVSFWVAGGWGIDLLLGEQTRSHNDMDVCIDASGDGERRALEALGQIGYRVAIDRTDSGPRFPIRSVLRDRQGRTLDLILVSTQAGCRTDRGEHPPVLPPDSWVTGRIDGHAIPCLGPELQIDAHRGYVPHPCDRHDMGRLSAMFDVEVPSLYRIPVKSTPPMTRARRAFGRVRALAVPGYRESALVVLVPEAQGVLGWVNGSRPYDLPAHITITHPFIGPSRLTDAVALELAELARAVERAEVQLTRLSSFPGVTYLAPEPGEPFVRLTESIFQRWPDHPPYDGAHDEIVPHLTVAFEVEPADIACTVDPLLPIEAEVTELTLMAQDRFGRWREKMRFPLGTAPER